MYTFRSTLRQDDEPAQAAAAAAPAAPVAAQDPVGALVAKLCESEDEVAVEAEVDEVLVPV